MSAQTLTEEMKKRNRAPVQAGLHTTTAFELRPLDGWDGFSPMPSQPAAGYTDSRKVALQFLVGDRYAGWRVCAHERNFEDHDREQDPERRRRR
jgi:hypothetical protein